ncbi:MAG: S-layer homology domain-containing protein [Clostridia bacterium]|nr:S-layer homology domain-containing protein [Clostridia bacterium]
MILKRILSLLTAAALLTASFAVDAVSTETAETNPLPAAPVEFTDTAGHWAIGAIERWSELGIIIGESDGRFRPDDPVTRAEMAIILQRVLRYKTVSEERFADLTEDWYIDPIQQLRAAGVMKGDENNCANPYDPITREEAVVMLARAFLMEPSEAEMSFPDAASISDWARGYVAALTEAGFISGSDGGNFFPADPLTRAEAVTILDNMITACFYAEGSYDYRPFQGLADFVIVAADNVDVLNFDIGGDIFLTEGVDYESVRFKQVNHYGRVMQYTPEGYVRHLKAASYIVPINHSLPLCRHDSSKFIKGENGHMTYADPNVEWWFGVDVSSWQGNNIDWKKLKEEGVYFAFIRVGYRGYESGLLNEDTNFRKNVEGALEAGIKVGVYFFSQALNPEEAMEEANFVLDRIRDYDISFPVVFDWETISSDTARTNDIETEQLCQAANVFCHTVRDAGYIPMVYSNQSVSLLNYDLGRLQEWDFWYAEYKEYPTFYYDFDIWQYGSSGIFKGVPDAYVDTNISFIDYSKIKP